VTNPWLDMERRRSEVNRHGENAPRLANAWASYKTTGWGEVSFPNCHEFDLTFAERPYTHYGHVVLSNSLPVTSPGSDEVLIDTRFPRCSGGVYQWKVNSRGFYTGAWVYVTVDTQSPFIQAVYEEPNYTIQHHFTFEGIGIKDLPEYDVDEGAEDAKSRGDDE
jgi:hypothetical protein